MKNLIKLNILSSLIMILGAYRDTDFVFIAKVIFLILFAGFTILSIIMTLIYYPI